MLKQRKTPCPTCPYRRDTPLGIWHLSEYQRLQQYDKPTVEQPPRPFMCHYSALNKDAADTLCQGAIDCHGDQLLYLRLASIQKQLPPDFDIKPSGVDVYDSGADVYLNNLEAIQDPSDEAKSEIKKLESLKTHKKRSSHKPGD